MRVCVALHRERKRVQMIQLAARTRALEQENANLQFMLGLRDQEISKLRGNLASFPRSARDGEPRIQSAAASPSEPAELTGTARPPGALHASPPVNAHGTAPQPTCKLPSAGHTPAGHSGLSEAPSSGQFGMSDEGHYGISGPPSRQQFGQPGDDRIAPERGNESLPGMELALAVSFQGSSDPTRMVREQLQQPAQQRAPLLIDGLPIEIDERGMSTNSPGIIVGADGQWLRLKQRSASSHHTNQPQPPH